MPFVFTNNMESTALRIRDLKIATDLELSAYYRQKVQFQEKVDDNEWRLDFSRGAIQALTEAEDYLKDDNLQVALMRLQTRRVDVHRELNETFKKKMLLGQQYDELEIQVAYTEGYLEAKHDEKMEAALGILYMRLARTDNQRKIIESELHYRRGMAASEDEIEKIIQQGINPNVAASSVETSPGTVGPDFNGQAMPKPDKIEFPNDNDHEVTYPEFDPGTYQPLTLHDVVESEVEKAYR